MDRNEYMTTGEFASAMGVSKDTLFHYDDIGLFCPEKVSENGYRYYSIYQMETFDTIRMLRDLGMPLKEIRDMLAHRSPERVMHVFAGREQQIDRQIEKLKEMKQWLSRRREKIADAEKTDFSEVTIQAFPERYYLYGHVADGLEKSIYRKTSELIAEFKKSGMRSDYDAAYIQYDENVAQLVKVQRGELLSSNSGSLTTNFSGGNAVWYDTVDTVGDGTLLELHFRVKESESFETTSVSVYPRDHIEKNFNNLVKEAIPCVWQAGKIACRVGELSVDDSLMLEENGTLHYEIEDIPWGEETKTVSLIAACYQGGRLVDLQMVQKDLTLGDQSILIKNKEEYDEVRLFFLDDKAYEPLVQVLKIMKGAS